ncbi:hypothetical protein [Spirillospora sp. CA-294931]|uniref:hypothetical protein n=1 Tax=Spirillospora sp. CA-294931 TaxID=3240042 RepID=UPI003D8A1BED
MRRPIGKALATWAVATAVVTLLGPLAGLLWSALVPDVTYVVVQGEPLLADPEGQGPIGIDGRFAVIALVAGLVCGVVAYLFGGRGRDLPLLFALAVGGFAAAFLAWKVGHWVGLSDFERTVRAARDDQTVTGVADLRAKGVLSFWPLLAVLTYGLLEAIVKRLPADDRRKRRSGEADEVAGGELDLESAPAGGDVDGRQP